MFLKRLSPRTLFSLTPSSSPSPYSIFIAQCSTSSPSHLTYSHAHSHPDSRNVRVSVWWDIDNCNVPSGVNVFSATQAITAAIESSGIKGPIEITAFGDMVRLSRTNQEAYNSTLLNFTGFEFCHVPPDGGLDSVNRSLFMNLMFWVAKNPPPAHLFLIIVDRGFTSSLYRLRAYNYNILLASKEPGPAVLRTAANIVWNWDVLVRGENLTGRYFNQPTVEIWYGHYERPLEDRFAEIEAEIERTAFVPDDQPGEVLQQKHSKSKADEVFSQDSFWRDVQTFLITPVGSLIVLESRTRKKMAYYLQKYGPSVLKSITEYDVLRMVDRLISEKKWVREYPNLFRPFILTSSARITSANSDCTYSDSDSDYEEDDFSDSE